MASAYITDLDQEVTQEDLANFYRDHLMLDYDPHNYGEGMAPGAKYNIKNLNEINNSREDPDEFNDSDEELEYELELYSKGNINQLAKLQNKPKKFKHNKINDHTVRSPPMYHVNLDNNMPKTKTSKIAPPSNPNSETTISKEAMDKIRQIRSDITETERPTVNHPFLGDVPINKKKKQKILDSKRSVYQTQLPKQSTYNSPSSNSVTSPPPSSMTQYHHKNNVGNIQQQQETISRQPNTSQPEAPGVAPVLQSGQITDKKAEEMHKLMREWLALDEDINEVKSVLKILNAKKKHINDLLLKDMNNFQVGFLTEGPRQLKYQVSYPKKGYKKDYIETKLKEYFKDTNLATKVADYLEESRPRGERVSLQKKKIDLDAERKKLKK